MVRIPKECRKYRCKEPHYRMGLCQKHYDEHNAEEARRSAAVKALHFSKYGESYFENEAIREELFEVQKWWRRSCDALNYGRNDEVLGDEAEAASVWCIAIAKELVDAEARHRRGEEVSAPVQEELKRSLWERFGNLEAGLRSNGTEKPCSGA